MKALFLPIAVAAALWTGATYGQQRTTCSQQLVFCNSGCESQYKKGMCRARCQEWQANCMATGFWTNPNTGEKVPRRRE